MSFTVHVKMKKLGKQNRVDIAPVVFELDEKPQTVRELLVNLTRLGVRQYNERKDRSDKAVENTLQCFEDGIYRVFAGEEELTALSDAIPWKDDIVFTFIRLTMLSGW